MAIMEKKALEEEQKERDRVRALKQSGVRAPNRKSRPPRPERPLRDYKPRERNKECTSTTDMKPAQ